MTHGRGITESTLSKWVHAMPRCIPICNALEDFTAVHTSTSEQHKDLRASTEMRDNSDTIRFEQWLHVHSPFKEQVTDDLVSLVNGVVADGSVNCDDAIISIGQRARSKMIGHPYGDITLHRKDKVNSLGSMKNTIKVRGEVVVNHDVLFNRITCVLNTSSELDNFIQYELAPQLPSLCVDGQMRKGTKSALGKSLKALVTCQKVAPDDAEYVVDGGHLLHAIIWSKPATYKDICEAYRDFVIQYRNVTVVFDGYDGPPSTKSAEHDRRARLGTSVDIIIDPSLPTTTPQKDFLTNGKNQTRLIHELTKVLNDAGVTVKQAEADADHLIVTTALEIASQNGKQVVVVGTDTDLLVMLIA